MLAALKKLYKNEEGQGMVEYGLIIGLISVVVVAILASMGGQLKVLFNAILVALGGTAVP